MPYVHDTSSFKEARLSYGQAGASALIQYGSQRAQFGYRSGVSLPETPPILPNITHGPTNRSVLSGLDHAEVYFSVRKSDGWAEHNRDYDEVNLSSPCYVECTDRRKSAAPGTGYRSHPNILLASRAPQYELSQPDDDEVRGAAESLARSTVPDRPYLNVTRTLGELRDAPQLIAVANYVPFSSRDVGGAYLNQVFGAQPTVGDMQRLGEVVHRVLPAVRDEISGCSEIIRRDATREFSRVSGSVRSAAGSTSTSPKYLGPSHAGLEVWGMFGGSDIQFHAGISWHESISLRAYGRYARAVVRMDSMNRSLGSKLRPLLGSGLSADVIYDLTPYTWLLNWVKDFGSVLKYQESLNGADVVAVGHGYNLRQEKHVGWTASFRENPNGSLYSLESQRAGVGSSSRRSDRRQGGTSPYSLTTSSWDSLSGTQWAILGALGLSRSPGVPLLAERTKRIPLYRNSRARRDRGFAHGRSI